MIPEQLKSQIEQATKIEEELLKATEAEYVGDDQPATDGEQSDIPAKQDSEEEESTPKEYSEEEDASSWEHKYRVLQGKYNKEVPRLHEEIRSVKQENDFLRSKLELLERLVVENPKSAGSQHEESSDEDDDIATLKNDFPEIYKAIEKMLRKSLPKEAESKASYAAQAAQQAVMATFQMRLSSLVPDWQQLNTDPEFLDWLKQRDRFSRKTRHDLMLEAFSNGDAETVAEFFNAFKSISQEQTQKAPQKQHISPPVGKSKSPGAQSSRTFKQSEIEEFYRRAALGKVDPQTKDRFEREILQAMKDGRVFFNQ